MGRGWTWLGLVALIAPAQATAQGPSDLRLRFEGSGGFVASGDQQSFFGLDLPVAGTAAHVGWVAHPNIVLEARLSGAAFFSSAGDPGGLVDLSVGAEVGGDVDVARLWGRLHAGAGITGSLVRPVLHLAFGIDVRATDDIALGPFLAYGHLFQDDGEGYSDDAAWVSVGASLTYRPPTAAPAPVAPPPRPRPRAPAPPRTPPPPPPPPVAPDELLDMLDEAAGLEPRELLVPVLFHFDSTALVACSVASLRSLRDHLIEHDEIAVLEIEGHADGSGSDAYNRDLSLRRAEAIRDWLVENGVAPERLRVAARGESAPVEGNEEESGREQNRRARFRVVMER